MMEKISINELKNKLSYEKDTGNLRWKIPSGRMAAGLVAGHLHTGGYWRILINGKKYPAHRVAWAIFYGVWPSDQIDHIDGNKSNNAIANLRIATPSMNQLYNNNARRGNKTGLLGVRVMRGKFSSQIKVNGSVKWLGVFDKPEDAHAAYIAEKARAIEAAHNIGGGK